MKSSIRRLKYKINRIKHVLSHSYSLSRTGKCFLVLLLFFKTIFRISNERYELLRDYIIATCSPFFDSDWYIRQYISAGKTKIGALKHFCKYGFKEGRMAGPLFDCKYYLQCNPEVKNIGMNPVSHYVLYGHENGCNHGDYVKKPSFSNRIVFSNEMREIKRDFKIRPSVHDRMAVFAMFSEDGIIDNNVLTYLNGLLEVVDNIVLVADNPIRETEIEKIKRIVCHCEFSRHLEYDFGSYRRGWEYIITKYDLLNKPREIVFCNDSCYGPVCSFDKVFSEMSGKYDLWGLTANNFIEKHIQSYFFVADSSVFLSEKFKKFFCSIRPEKTVSDVIRNYEIKMTRAITDDDSRIGIWINLDDDETYAQYKKYSADPVHYPVQLINKGFPLVKAKALSQSKSNIQGVLDTIKLIKSIKPEIIPIGLNDKTIDISFSIIVPAWNRAHCIVQALNSVLNQTYKKFEIIIIDDGSTDRLDRVIKRNFDKEIKKEIIKYIRISHSGVSAARNEGLKRAKNEWIAYLDSDNVMHPAFLETFAIAISKQTQESVLCAYCKMKMLNSGKVIGEPFSLEKLIKRNYIDLGTFVHHRSLYEKLGGFDLEMTRLVDWDLIIRYTDFSNPIFIDSELLAYSDDDNSERISKKESYAWNYNHIREKYGNSFIVTTIIPTYNHEKYIEKAIESAVMQKGDFVHEIIISSDGSTDSTNDIINIYEHKYPTLIKNISSDKNVGISQNVRKLIQAAHGKYVAILEGDDYWSSISKLQKQVECLEENKNMSMIFSRINVLNEETGEFKLLSRQKNLKRELTGEDFINDPNQNLIGNFSCCMFRSDILKGMPSSVFNVRINEISVAFYFEQKGVIGYLPNIMSVYRQHKNGVWTGASKKTSINSAIVTRENALSICDEKYKKRFLEIISKLKAEKEAM